MKNLLDLLWILSTLILVTVVSYATCPGVGTGRQAGFRFLCPLGREGSNPSLGTNGLSIFSILNYASMLP